MKWTEISLSWLTNHSFESYRWSFSDEKLYCNLFKNKHQGGSCKGAWGSDLLATQKWSDFRVLLHSHIVPGWFDNFQSCFYPSLDFRATHSKAFVKVLVMLGRGCLINHRTSQDLKSNGSWKLITQATTLNNPKVLFGVCPAVLFVALLTWLWRSFAPGYGNNPFGTLATWITIQPWLWLIGILKWLKEDPIFPDKPRITTKTPSLVETLAQSMNHTYFSGLPSLLHASCGYWHWQKHWEHPEALNASMESKSP